MGDTHSVEGGATEGTAGLVADGLQFLPRLDVYQAPPAAQNSAALAATSQHATFCSQRVEEAAGWQHAQRGNESQNAADKDDDIIAYIHDTVSRLLNDRGLLAKQCRCLLPPGAAARCFQDSGFNSDTPCIYPEELGSVTQILMERLGCRHPFILKQVSKVHSSFLGRSRGLSFADFQGYITSVLSQILFEFETHDSAAGRYVCAHSDQRSEIPVCSNHTNETAAAAACLLQNGQQSERVAIAQTHTDGLSDIQRVTQELSCLTNSLAQRVGPGPLASSSYGNVLVFDGSTFDRSAKALPDRFTLQEHSLFPAPTVCSFGANTMGCSAEGSPASVTLEERSFSQGSTFDAILQAKKRTRNHQR